MSKSGQRGALGTDLYVTAGTAFSSEWAVKPLGSFEQRSDMI